MEEGNLKTGGLESSTQPEITTILNAGQAIQLSQPEGQPDSWRWPGAQAT